MVKLVVLLACIAVVAAFPSNDPVLMKWDAEGLRYSYMEDDQGNAHLVDHWMKLSDIDRNARYNPDSSNQYHLFTWSNRWLSQPLALNDVTRLRNSNYNPQRETIILMHGFLGSVQSAFNTVLVPAYLAAADCNVIVLDWSAGASWGPRARQAGEAAARFINWVISVSGNSAASFHIVGYSVGGHGAGIMARNVAGNVGYVIGLDPAERWDEDTLFRPSDGTYTEVIHTSTMGEQRPMGQVDFYPNGGSNMPGCLTALCDHYRSYYYLGESLQTGGFTGRRCLNVQQATSGACNQAGTLQLGGIRPKTGNTGIFHLTTNRRQPFSQG